MLRDLPCVLASGVAKCGLSNPPAIDRLMHVASDIG